MVVHRDDVHFVDKSARATRVTLVGSVQASEASGSDASVTLCPLMDLLERLAKEVERISAELEALVDRHTDDGK